MISTKYSTEITTQNRLESIEKYEKGKQESTCLLVCLPNTNEENFRISLLKNVLPFLPIKSHNLSSLCGGIDRLLPFF